MITNKTRIISRFKAIKNFADIPTGERYHKGWKTKNSSKFLRGKDEDVHSYRLAENYKYESGTEDLYSKLKRDQYKFVMDQPQNDAEPLYLDDLNIINIENEATFHRVPKLAHGLENIVLKPGIYSLQEMGMLQKDGGKYLSKVYDPSEIEWTKIPDYIPPSKDKLLLKFAQESKIKYVMSTSTISAVLSQFYFLFSSFKNPNFENVFEEFEEPRKYMISQRKPTTSILRILDKEKEIYALDSDSGIFTFKNMVLLDLGKILERFLTLSETDFRSALVKKELDPNFIIDDDHHRFMKLNNNICLRSQIDCQAMDPITKKPFVFEIKTRSVCPIRYDLYNYQEYLDYKVVQTRGLHSSFEREYYDLVRGGFLKYAFQLRIGRMDGAFIAYHNTKEIFGFEYVKTTEIERRIFGSSQYAEVCFMVCSKLLTETLDRILEDLKGETYQSIKFGFYSCSFLKKMIIFAELMKEDDTGGKETLIDQTDSIKDEMDYYTKYKKLTNKIFKFDCFVYPFINGVQQKLYNFSFEKGDQLEVRFKLVNCGRPSFADYMNFLHEAYKIESLNIDLSYTGVWGGR